jgi:SH3-like domain-containing protein
MKSTLATICLTLAVHLGSAACATNSVKGLVIASGAVTEKPKSGLEVSFIKPEVTLRSKPNLRSSAKVVKQAIGKKAVLLKQNKTWIQIRFEEVDFWVRSHLLGKNLKPAVMEVLFKVSDVNLRSGPGRGFRLQRS